MGLFRRLSSAEWLCSANWLYWTCSCVRALVDFLLRLGRGYAWSASRSACLRSSRAVREYLSQPGLLRGAVLATLAVNTIGECSNAFICSAHLDVGPGRSSGHCCHAGLDCGRSTGSLVCSRLQHPTGRQEPTTTEVRGVPGSRSGCEHARCRND